MGNLEKVINAAVNQAAYFQSNPRQLLHQFGAPLLPRHYDSCFCTVLYLLKTDGGKFVANQFLTLIVEA